MFRDFMISRLGNRRLLAGLIAACSVAVVAFAAAPAWWSDREVLTEQPANDYAAINQGQLKQLAAQAIAEMDEKLPGGAGQELTDLVAAWRQPPAAELVRNDFAPVAHGQLKTVAKLFYDRLAEESYTGPPLVPGRTYPWSVTTTDDINHTPANIGQAKFLFSFNLTAYTLDIQNPTADDDGDGLTNLDEAFRGTDPVLADTDGDGIPDGFEIARGLNPLVVDPVAISGLRLFLTAGAGVDVDEDGLVLAWHDQSSHGHTASAPSEEARPALATDPLSGAVVLRFDGADDQLVLSDVMAGATAGEIFIVSRLKNFDNAYNGLAQFGTDNGVAYSEDEGGLIWEDFGTSPGAVFQGPGASVLTQTHIYNASITPAGISTVRFNGIEIFTRSTENVVFNNQPLVGNDSYDEFFKGDIAAIIIYDRPLTPAERAIVEAWLTVRYVVAGPPAPVDVKAQALSPSQISLWWTGDQTLSYTVERKTGDGDYETVGTTSVGSFYIDENLDVTTTYIYRIKASKDGADSAYSELTTATTLAVGADFPVANLRMWLKADAGVVVSDTGIGQWLDQSGRGSHAVSDNPSNPPQLIAGQINGLPVVRFNEGQQMNLPDVMAGATAGEIIAVVKVVNKNLGEYDDKNNKLWNFNQSGVGYDGGELGIDYYHYNTFGTDDSDHGSEVPVFLVSDYHIFDTASSSELWVEYYNGVLFTSDAGQPASFTASPNLGSGVFVGDFAEILVFDRALTSAERTAVETWLHSKYQFLSIELVLNDPNGDADGDGVPNEDEVNIYHTNPNRNDTDGDGFSDGYEIAMGLNPRVNDLAGDLDGDGVRNDQDARPNATIGGQISISIISPISGSAN